MRGTTHNSIGGIVSRPFDKLRAGSCRERKGGAPAVPEPEGKHGRLGHPVHGVVDGMTPLAR